MAFFSKPDPVATAQAAVDVAVKARAGLYGQLADAQVALDAATVAANALANDGADDEILGKAEARATESEKLVKRRLLAVESKDAEVTKLETARDEAADQKQRTETVIYNHRLKDELIKEGEFITASAARMSAICERAALIAPEAEGFRRFSDVLVTQGPEAVALIAKLIDNDSAAVLRRDAPAKGKKLVVPVVRPVVTPPVRMTLFCTRSLKYTDPDSGTLIVIQKFQDGEFPPSIAKVALDLKVCTRVSDPLRKQHHGTYPGHADPQHAFDLDAAMLERNTGPKLVEPIRQSTPQFEVTIGQPKQVRIS